jgi:hypothetical protein
MNPKDTESVLLRDSYPVARHWAWSKTEARRVSGQTPQAEHLISDVPLSY